jgi:uncharacterized protein YgiM (DUF1202 family)
MAGFEKLSEAALEDVVGGVTRVVNTHTDKNAAVRANPGLSYQQVASLKNGTRVNTTGETVRNTTDGRIWYQIDSPVDGWIAGSLIGLRD